MRTGLADAHQPVFAALSGEQARLVYARLSAQRALRIASQSTPPTSGEELFRICQIGGLDRARIALSLARETTPVGVQTLEIIAGCPVRPWAATVRAQQEGRPAPAPRGAATSRPRDTDAMVVVSYVPNPKRPGTAGHVRYIWRVGALVSELIAEGMWPADVKWDLDRGFVKLASASSPEGQAARAQATGCES